MPGPPAQPDTQDHDTIDQRVQAEMTRLPYRSAGFGLFSNAILAILLAAGVRSYFSAALTLGWLSAILIITAARIALNAAFFTQTPVAATLPRWRLAFLLPVSLSGLVWGIAGWAFL